MSSTRFTLDGYDALERRLALACHAIARAVRALVPQEDLEALLLGGGYGRGEGGVLRRGQTDAPYNDLEFFLFIKGPTLVNERRYRPGIHELEARMTQALGIDVELKILSKQQFDRQPTTMFYYDLVQGHHVLCGPSDFLFGHPHGNPSAIPAHEATRLLFNRFSGLLYAADRLQRTPFHAHDADFVFRNLAKAKLAMGDALLTLEGAYHWSCGERGRRLGHLKWGNLPAATLQQLHLEGLQFKLHPSQPALDREQLLAQWEALLPLAWQTWQWVEARRLQQSLPDPKSYARFPGSLCPETSPLKNALLRLRQFGVKGWKHHPLRYPREALLRSLALLLWEQDRFEENRRDLERELQHPLAQWQDAAVVYEKLWHRYN